MPRFRPGQSGNPKGRPPGGTALAERIRALAGDNGASYVQMLHDLVMDEQQPTRFRIDAVKILFDRGFGKPPQEIHVTGEHGLTDEQIAGLSLEQAEEIRALYVKAAAVAMAGANGES